MFVCNVIFFYAEIVYDFLGFAFFFLFLSKVELIGYAATVDELFVVYEYVQKGMLKNHLHEPQSKGKRGLIPTRHNEMFDDDE